MKPLISVIVPVYKVEEYLDRCVDSIVNQTYKNLEIILVDDGSPDNCPNMCDEWANKDNRIIVVHKENGGVSSARNAGISVSNGKYLSFVDSDDYIENDFYESLIEGFDSANVQLSVCGIIWDDRTKSFSNETLTIEKNDTEIALFDIVLYPYFEGFVWNKLYVKQIIVDNNLLFDSNYKMCEDTLFNFDYIKCINSVYICNKALYHYKYRPSSVMNVKPNQNDFDTVYLIEHFFNNTQRQEVKNIIIEWSFKYWIKAIDDYIVTKKGKQYYRCSIDRIKQNKKYILTADYFSFVEKVFCFLLCHFKLPYVMYKYLALKLKN